VGQKHSRFGPEVSWEELQRRKVRLRLVELERGAVNVVLMRSRFPEIRLGQLGLVINEVERERILGRAKADGIRVRDHDFRWLLATGQRFDLELSSAERHPYGDDARADLCLDRVEIGCGDPSAVNQLFASLLGREPCEQIRFLDGPSAYAELRSATFTGRSEVASARLPLHV